MHTDSTQCMHTTHTYTHACAHMHPHPYSHITHINACTHYAYMHISHMHTCVHLARTTHTCGQANAMYMHVHACTCTCTHTYACVHTCSCPLRDKELSWDRQQRTVLGLQCGWGCLSASCLVRPMFTVGSVSTAPQERPGGDGWVCSEAPEEPYRWHCPPCPTHMRPEVGAEERRNQEGVGVTTVYIATAADNKSQEKNKASLRVSKETCELQPLPR